MTRSDGPGADREDEDELLTVAEVKALTKYGYTQIYGALHSGTLKSIQRTFHARYRVRRGDAKDWVQRGAPVHQARHAS